MDRELAVGIAAREMAIAQLPPEKLKFLTDQEAKDSLGGARWRVSLLKSGERQFSVHGSFGGAGVFHA